MLQHLAPLILAALVLAPPALAQAPGAGLVSGPAFSSWEPPSWQPPGRVAAFSTERPAARDRLGNGLLGGVVGAAAGVVFCTVVSNIANDPGTGFSTCTAKGYLLTGGIGLGLGFLVGFSL